MRGLRVKTVRRSDLTGIQLPLAGPPDKGDCLTRRLGWACCESDSAVKAARGEKASRFKELRRMRDSLSGCILYGRTIKINLHLTFLVR